MPIIPTDLFPREVSSITGINYSKIKIPFDVICLGITALTTFIFLHDIRGLGIGTVLAAFSMGKAISLIGIFLDKHFVFVRYINAGDIRNKLHQPCVKYNYKKEKSTKIYR